MRKNNKHDKKTNRNTSEPGLDSLLFLEKYARVLSQIEAGYFEDSLKSLKPLLKLYPNAPYLLSSKAQALTQLGQNDAALPLFRQVARSLPGQATPLINIGVVLLRKGAFAEALPVLEEAMAICPNNFTGMYNLATCLIAMNQTPERAEQLLRAADQLMPNFQSLWFSLGHALADQGKLVEADSAYRKAIELDPNSDFAEQAALARRNLMGELPPYSQN